MTTNPLNIIAYVVGILAVFTGCYSIFTRNARFPGINDNDEHRVVEGFPAILVGLVEIGVGLYFFPGLREHFPIKENLRFLLGIASIGLGVFTLFTRSATYSRDGENIESTGIRAVGIGVIEIVFGVYLIALP